MEHPISWKECVEKGIILKIPPDKERSVETERMACLRFEFWKKPVEEKFTALKIEAYYEIIKELIFAHLYKNGYNCKDHVCLIAYLKERFKDFDFETGKIDELRRIRNAISYRGFAIRKDYLKRNELELRHIIKRLMQELS